MGDSKRVELKWKNLNPSEKNKFLQKIIDSISVERINEIINHKVWYLNAKKKDIIEFSNIEELGEKNVEKSYKDQGLFVTIKDKEYLVNLSITQVHHIVPSEKFDGPFFEEQLNEYEKNLFKGISNSLFISTNIHHIISNNINYNSFIEDESIASRNWLPFTRVGEDVFKMLNILSEKGKIIAFEKYRDDIKKNESDMKMYLLSLYSLETIFSMKDFNFFVLKNNGKYSKQKTNKFMIGKKIRECKFAELEIVDNISLDNEIEVEFSEILDNRKVVEKCKKIKIININNIQGLEEKKFERINIYLWHTSKGRIVISTKKDESKKEVINKYMLFNK